MEERDEEAIVREAMRIIGSRTSERKKQTSATNGRSFSGHSEETKEKLRLAQQARRERERHMQMASETPQAQPRRVGRPRTRPIAETTEKRPVGRPKKQVDVQGTSGPNASVRDAQGTEEKL